MAFVNASNGYICGTGTGTVRIYAEATDGSGKRDYCTVTVSSDVWVTSITLNQTSLKLNPNGSYTLSATVLPDNANNKRLYWTSSNEAVAVVNDGVVSGLEVGTAVITALSTDGSAVRATCEVTVTEGSLVESVIVSPAYKTMDIGESVCLDKIVCPQRQKIKA